MEGHLERWQGLVTFKIHTQPDFQESLVVWVVILICDILSKERQKKLIISERSFQRPSSLFLSPRFSVFLKTSITLHKQLYSATSQQYGEQKESHIEVGLFCQLITWNTSSKKGKDFQQSVARYPYPFYCSYVSLNMKHLRFQPIPSLHVQQLLINLCLNLNPKLNLALKSTVCRQKINLSNVQQSILKTGCRAQVRIHQLMKNISDVTFCREKNAVNKVKNKIKGNQLAMKRENGLHVKFFVSGSLCCFQHSVMLRY